MRVATAARAIATGQWMQVAFTWDGTVGTAAAAHLFINGEEKAKPTAGDGSGFLVYTKCDYPAVPHRECQLRFCGFAQRQDGLPGGVQGPHSHAGRVDPAGHPASLSREAAQRQCLL